MVTGTQSPHPASEMYISVAKHVGHVSVLDQPFLIGLLGFFMLYRRKTFSVGLVAVTIINNGRLTTTSSHLTYL